MRQIVIRILSAVLCGAGVACGFFLPLMGLPAPLAEPGEQFTLFQLFVREGILAHSAKMLFLLIPSVLGLLTLILCLAGAPGLVRLLGGAACAGGMFMLPGMVTDHAISLSGAGEGMEVLFGGFSAELVTALLDHDFTRGLGFYLFFWAFAGVTLLSLLAALIGGKPAFSIESAPLAIDEITPPARRTAKVRRVSGAAPRGEGPAVEAAAAGEALDPAGPGIACLGCGAVNEDDSRFCAHCGRELGCELAQGVAPAGR